MRTVIYNYIRDLRVQGLTLTDNLPFDDNGAPVYHHNKKHIYVDVAQIQQQPVFDTLDDSGVVNQTTTVSVYFVYDAKKLLPDYDDVIQSMAGARTAAGTEGYTQKLCQVLTSFDTDALITHLEFSFRKLITN